MRLSGPLALNLDNSSLSSFLGEAVIMKKSRKVALVLLGVGAAVTLSGCEDSKQNVSSKRNQYANRADCVADWGDKDCPREAQRTSGGGFVYMGPHYFWSPGGGPMVVGSDGAARAASGTYLNQPGASANTVSRSSVGSVSGISSVSSSSIGRAAASSSTSVSRGGFGSTSSSMSSGG